MQNVPDKFYSNVEKMYAGIEENLSRRSLKYLSQLQKQENRLNQKLCSFDSTETVVGKAYISDGYELNRNSALKK